MYIQKYISSALLLLYFTNIKCCHELKKLQIWLLTTNSLRKFDRGHIERCKVMNMVHL